MLRAPGWGAGARRSSFSRSPGLSVLVSGDGSAETGRLRVRKGRRPPPSPSPGRAAGPAETAQVAPLQPAARRPGGQLEAAGPLRPGIREGGAGARREEAPRLAGPPALVACRLFRWEHTAWEPVAMLL